MTLTDQARYQKRWRYERAHGLKRLIDATPAREHLRSLLACGEVSVRGIAEAVGMSPSAVSKIANGGQRSLRKPTAERLLAVTLDDILARTNPAGFVPKHGAVRRVRALQAIGHPVRDIASTAGLSVHDIYNVTNQAGRWIYRSKHDAIVTAYEAISMTPGRNSHAKGRAKARGWAPPLAWDDETIDDPKAGPFVDYSARALGGQKFTLDDVQDCIDWGMDRAQAAHRLGVQKSAIEHRCAREARLDLLADLDHNGTKADLRLTVAS